VSVEFVEDLNKFFIPETCSVIEESREKVKYLSL
jgi:hypothetical protein